MAHEKPPVRYRLLDAIRGAAVLNMLAYHLCYNIFCVFGIWTEFYRRPAVVLWEHLISCTFILVSGMSMNFSRHGYRRGLLVFLSGWLITLVTVLLIPQQQIWFGVLNLIGIAIILTFALRKALNRIPPPVGTLGFFILFVLCYGVPYGYLGLFTVPLIELPQALYQFRPLALLGFPDSRFFSADYFPLLPWIFLYLCGYSLWRLIAQKGRQDLFIRRIPVLDFVGRHSLIIYLVHQPVLYGLCWLWFTFIQ